MRDEIWKDIPGYEGEYQVSNLGMIKSLKRGIIRKICPQKSGHLNVKLSKNGIKKFYGVHRLVLQAFVGPCPENYECRHFPDRNPANNRLDNLSWGTAKQNHLDCKVHGTDVAGERNGRCKLNDKQIEDIRQLKKQGRSSVWIANYYNLSKGYVNKILRGENRKCQTQEQGL